MDMTQLAPLLAQLGPWGPVIAFALVYLGPKALDWIKARFPNVKLPTAPAIPKPTDPVLSPSAPIARPVDLILNALIAGIRRRRPTEDAEQLAAEVIAREMVYPVHTAVETDEK